MHVFIHTNMLRQIRNYHDVANSIFVEHKLLSINILLMIHVCINVCIIEYIKMCLILQPVRLAGG
jgi:hypothetical protein